MEKVFSAHSLIVWRGFDTVTVRLSKAVLRTAFRARQEVNSRKDWAVDQ